VKPVSLNVAILFAAIPGILCAIPSFWLLYQIPHTPNQAALLPSTYITAGWSAISITHAYLLSFSKTAVLNRLEEVVEKFARENKLFEQRLWVARHIWYTLLHGTVQSAVTAASIRSTAIDQKSQTVKTLIVADLNRAMEALRNPIPERLQLEEQLEELKKTWDGIVEIIVNISEELAKEINNSRESVIIFNELLKEVLSNSVRHGQSSKVEITFTEPTPGEVNLFVVNNGTKPKKSAASSIGSSIFKSVCLSTELIYNKETKDTEFTALVPIAIN
jgi:signal transduction histidine kinase